MFVVAGWTVKPIWRLRRSAAGDQPEARHPI